jgi:hypothetical protein
MRKPEEEKLKKETVQTVKTEKNEKKEKRVLITWNLYGRSSQVLYAETGDEQGGGGGGASAVLY